MPVFFYSSFILYFGFHNTLFISILIIFLFSHPSPLTCTVSSSCLFPIALSSRFLGFVLLANSFLLPSSLYAIRSIHCSPFFHYYQNFIIFLTSHCSILTYITMCLYSRLSLSFFLMYTNLFLVDLLILIFSIWTES